MYISDKLTPNALTFEDFQIKPHTAEEMIVRFVRLFRPVELQRAPIDRNIKSYAIEESRA